MVGLCLLHSYSTAEAFPRKRVLILTNWVNIALLSAAIFGIVSIIDSHLLTKRFPGLRVFLLPVGIIYLVYGCIFFFLFPLPDGIGPWPILVALTSSLLRTAAIIIMFYILKREEGSRVIPLVYTYPIFVAIIAVPLLGETLYYLDWLAIIMVVAGALLVSYRQDSYGSIIWRGKPLLFLFGSSLLLAMADITGKYALGYVSPWNMFWLGAFFMSGTFIMLSMRPHIIRQLGDMTRKKTTAALLLFNELLAPTAILLMFLALESGLVSLVSTIVGSSRPVFVLAFAFLLSRIFPEFLAWHADKRMLVFRVIAILMIAGGIIIIQAV